MVCCENTFYGKLIDKLRTDNDKLRTDNDKLRTDNDAMVEKLRSDNEELRTDNDKLRTDNDAMVEKLRSDNEELRTNMKVLQAKVEIYKSQAKESKDCIEQIAKQPKMITTTTTNILNMHTLDLSDDRVKNLVDQHYNIDYLLAGAKGVAQFTVDKVLTKPDDKVIYSLTDRSREAYNFKNVEGVIEKDTKGRKLREVVYKNGLKEKALSIANTMVLEDPVKADELRCIEYALEVVDLDPNTIRTKEMNDKAEHAYCKELRETAC
jgi:hypothetical protein